MAYRGVIEDIRRCIKLQKPSRVPVFACGEEFDVRMSGTVYSDYNSNSGVMAKCQIEAINRFGYDWAWLQVDDCIEFEVLGVGVKGQGNILPATCDYLPASYETLNHLKLPDPKKDGRMPVLLDAIKRIKDEFGDTVCVTGRTAAPFSSVTLLYGITETLMLLYDNPQLVKDTARFFIELQSMWGTAQIEAGADALWVGDCNASGHLISVDDYMEFAFEGVKKCVEAYDRAGALVFIMPVNIILSI
jgi:uroporphyrinogen decarboxylase